MTSVRPPSSATFDALWESIDAEEEDDDLPPALSAGPPPPRKATEDRDTIQPPVPAGEYVATMMELGELDDPSEGVSPPPQPAVPKAPLPAKGLGLMMAPEREIIFDDHEQHGITDPAGIEARRNAVTAPVRPRIETPSPFARPGALPVPRAPSVPPPDDTDVTEPGMLSFEGLDAPDEAPAWRGFQDPGASAARPTPAAPAPAPAAVAMPLRVPARMTPPSRPRFTPSTRPAGLRLGKAPAAPPPAPGVPPSSQPVPGALNGAKP